MSISIDERQDSSEQKTQQLQLVVASDCPLIRYAILAALAGDPSVSICGEADTGPELGTTLETISTDMLILDVSMQNGLGIHRIEQCKEQVKDLRILVLSTHDEWLYVGRVLKAGAMGFLKKTASPEMVVDAVHHLSSGKKYITDEVLNHMLGQADASNGAKQDPVSQLTDRELQVFELLGEGITSRCIARRLNISPHTVETYRDRLKRKLDAKNGADLVFRAIVWSLLHG